MTVREYCLSHCAIAWSVEDNLEIHGVEGDKIYLSEGILNPNPVYHCLKYKIGLDFRPYVMLNKEKLYLDEFSRL